MKVQELLNKVKSLTNEGEVIEGRLLIPLACVYAFSFDGESFFLKLKNCNGLIVEFGKEESKVVFSTGIGIDKKLEWETLEGRIEVDYTDGYLVLHGSD